MKRRRAMGIVGSVLVHAALVAWPLSRVATPVEPVLDLVEIEIVDAAALPDASLAAEAIEAEAPAPHGDDPIDPVEPVLALPASSPPPPPRDKGEPPVEPDPVPASDAPAIEPAASGDAASDVESLAPSEPDDAAIDPISASATPRDLDPKPRTGSGPGGAGTSPHARAQAGHGVLDHSTYGAEIVRIVKAEIDRDPVPGIAHVDSIQVLLTVLPDGRLAWTREGRYGFAQVLRSSLGPLRTRRILRRIERASTRFPSHPRGFQRKKYIVDITVQFHS